YIQMVEVAKDWQQKGLALAMVSRLQKEFPDKKIDFGMTTQEGQALKEDAESGRNTIKAWYDSKNDKLYELPLGTHHTGFLYHSDQVPDMDFQKTYSGISKQQYIQSYGQFGKFPPKFDENLLESF